MSLPPQGHRPGPGQLSLRRDHLVLGTPRMATKGDGGETSAPVLLICGARPGQSGSPNTFSAAAPHSVRFDVVSELWSPEGWTA